LKSKESDLLLKGSKALKIWRIINSSLLGELEGVVRELLRRME